MRVNLGCGLKPIPGWINLDKFPCSDAVGFCDLDDPLPLDDNSCLEILLDNVIEHIYDIPKLLVEIERCLRPGGKVKIITPHFTSASSWRDPTHVHHLSYFSFDYIETNHRQNYFSSQLSIDSKKLSFSGGIMGLLGRVIFRLSPEGWEKKWCFLFRASTIYVELSKKRTHE